MLRDSRRHISPCQHPTSPNEQILNPHYPCSTDSPRSDVLSQAEQLDRCTTDSDCESMKFCHNTRAGESVCAACRPLRRRCPRNATCCPGTLCINDVCAQPDEGGVTTGLVSPVTRGKSGHHILESKPKKQPNSKALTSGDSAGQSWREEQTQINESLPVALCSGRQRYHWTQTASRQTEPTCEKCAEQP
ncbi:UNVERIFIED_CONTAM: hypothetical protein FKN15_019053 [Acipenser sinensis]